ncbi:unnamed protein product [Caretta caretta]
MSGQKRRWQDWPGSAWEPGPPKAARLSPEPGPSWRTDPCAILTDLEKLCDQRPQQLLPFLLEHDYQLEQLGESPGLSPARVYTLLRALKLAMESAGKPEQVQQVLALVLRPAFVLRSLLGFIAELESFQHQDGQIPREVMEDTVAALHHLLTASPKQTKTLLCYPVDLLFATVQRLQSRGFEFTWIIQKRLHDTKSLVDATFPRSSAPLASPAWWEDFHTLPVFPTPEEIFVDPGQKLKRNLPVGKFVSDVAYLDTHFRLLREDFIRPLRAGISAHFSLRNVDCGQVLFGTVVGGNRPELLKGAVWLDIKANHSDLLRQHLGKTSFIMVESPAFESYRHVLEGLQEMDPAQVLFQSYVVQCRTPVAPPTHFGDAVTFDLSVLRPTGRLRTCLALGFQGHVTAVDLTAVRPCDSYIWSPETFPHLDESQILAIRMALSREFVLIQGPPGTGKTFFGLQIVEILLRNQSQWWEDQRPFLVVCYTNHALDQFMEGTYDYQALGICPQSLGFQMRKTLQKQKESIAYRTTVLELRRRGILTDTELAAEIRDDNLARSWLRPKPADYTLEKKYFLGISLFERMINNQIPYVQLLYQHRMRPEISRLLVPLFYKQLKDHNAVAEYEKIKGMESSVFFIQHTAAESHSADSESYRNEFEASFLVSLSRYLLEQGYDQSQVTVLTPYHGQVLKIRTLMRRRDMGEVAVHAVDDFQGEENDIILL